MFGYEMGECEVGDSWWEEEREKCSKQLIMFNSAPSIESQISGEDICLLDLQDIKETRL